MRFTCLCVPGACLSRRSGRGSDPVTPEPLEAFEKLRRPQVLPRVRHTHAPVLQVRGGAGEGCASRAHASRMLASRIEKLRRPQVLHAFGMHALQSGELARGALHVPMRPGCWPLASKRPWLRPRCPRTFDSAPAAPCTRQEEEGAGVGQRRFVGPAGGGSRWTPRARRPSATLGSGASSARRRGHMVAPTRFVGPRERRFVGLAGTAKPKAAEKEVPLEDGPAESGENSAGLLRRPSWTRSSRRTRPTRQRPRRRPPHRVANTPGPCPLRPRAFARRTSPQRAGAEP